MIITRLLIILPARFIILLIPVIKPKLIRCFQTQILNCRSQFLVNPKISVPVILTPVLDLFHNPNSRRQTIIPPTAIKHSLPNFRWSNPVITDASVVASFEVEHVAFWVVEVVDPGGDSLVVGEAAAEGDGEGSD